jgi:hypothetical protein
MKNKQGAALITAIFFSLVMLTATFYVDKFIVKSEINTQETEESNMVGKQVGSVVRNPSPPSNPQPSQPTTINIKQYILQTQLIKDLPEERVIQLRFYDYGQGSEMLWKNSYILTTNNVADGVTNEYDIALWVPTRYIQYLPSKGLCGTIQMAKANEELSIRTELSKTTLLWRFRSMTEHRDCLGF